MCSAKRHARFTPRKRTYALQLEMSALGQKRTSARQVACRQWLLLKDL
jgi:hypothetical protein